MDHFITCGQCGTHTKLESPWSNECPGCGAMYNGMGQSLSDPSQWGEETGESFSENGLYVIGSGDQDADYDPETMTMATAMETRVTPAEAAALAIIEELYDLPTQEETRQRLVELVNTYQGICDKLVLPHEGEREQTAIYAQLQIFERERERLTDHLHEEKIAQAERDYRRQVLGED